MAIFVSLVLIASALLNFVFCQENAVTLGYEIFEETPQFTFVGNVGTDILETDLVSGLMDAQIKELKFSMLTDDAKSQYFRIEDDTGVLRTAQRIDREIICPQLSDCVISLSAGVLSNSFFAVVNIGVTINDLNDNAPSFLESNISRVVPENMGVGTSISVPTADDLDSPKYTIVSYQLVSGPQEFELVVSDSLDSMYLVLQQPLDRELKDKYTIIIEAVDGGPEPRKGRLEINIDILDVNDNHPEFTDKTYNVKVSEDWEINNVILRVTAVDTDLGANGEIIYGFTTKTKKEFSDTFRIDPQTGDIYLIKELDYEQKQQYVLVVTASEKNAESVPAEARVTVVVEDINDSPPVISITSLSDNRKIEVPESAHIGSFVAHIKVTDPDLGQSGKFSCQLNRNAAFDVREMFKGVYTLLTTASLDREAVAEYNIDFTCMDQGSPSLSSTKKVKVIIMDENDNDPVFSQESYAVSLNENNYPGRFLVQVGALDLDSGDNGAIHYALDESSSYYADIDRESGNVTARIAFDHEQSNEIVLHVYAIDHGEPPKTGSAVVKITVNDLNDEAPRFTMDKYTLSLYENNAIGQEVGSVSAYDPDFDPYNKFTYMIDTNTDESALNAFVIDSTSGKIFTKLHLDREERKEYNLVIRAVDSADTSLFTTALVVVYVTDRNDNSPVISFPSSKNNSVYLHPSMLEERIITQIKAEDKDSGLNGQMSFGINNGNEQNLFTLDPDSGYLLLNSKVNEIPKGVYHLVISVNDNGNPPFTVHANLNIVANKTISVHSANLARSSLIIGNNMTIVIVVAVISGLVIVILTVAIFMMCCRTSEKELMVKKRNVNVEEGVHKNIPTKKKEVSFTNEIQINNDIQYDMQLSNPSTDEYHIKSKQFNQINSECNTNKASQNNYLLMPMACGSKDSDSSHSEESTNTDSGRGSDTNDITDSNKSCDRIYNPNLSKDQEPSQHRYSINNNQNINHSLQSSLSNQAALTVHNPNILPVPPRLTKKNNSKPCKYHNRGRSHQKSAQNPNHIHNEQQQHHHHHQHPHQQHHQVRPNMHSNWEPDCVQLEDEVFTITPSHV